MKRTTLLLPVFFLVFAACKNPKGDDTGMKDGADTIKTEETANTNEAAPAEYDSAAMMKAWEAFMTPGDMHKLMAKWDGTWDGEVTAWMGPEPSKSTATVTNKMAMNGLYQIGDFSGTMMGSPFMGHSVLAYDNAKKEFVTTWVDNMGSGVVVMRGQWDEATKTLHLKGSQTDPMTGKDSDMREELKVIDDNTQLLTIYGAGPDGKEHKGLEINLKRRM